MTGGRLHQTIDTCRASATAAGTLARSKLNTQGTLKVQPGLELQLRPPSQIKSSLVHREDLLALAGCAPNAPSSGVSKLSLQLAAIMYDESGIFEDATGIGTARVAPLGCHWLVPLQNPVGRIDCGRKFGGRLAAISGGPRVGQRPLPSRHLSCNHLPQPFRERHNQLQFVLLLSRQTDRLGRVSFLRLRQSDRDVCSWPRQRPLLGLVQGARKLCD